MNNARRICQLCIPLLLAVVVANHQSASAQDENSTLPIPLRSQIPGDFFSAAVGPQRTLERLQHDFDIYSWETFVAINWPADKNGEANDGQIIGNKDDGDHPTVWEHWKSVLEVFLPDGQEPVPWGKRSTLSQLLPGADMADFPKEMPVNHADKNSGFDPVELSEAYSKNDFRVITKLGKMHSWFQDEQAFDSGPLVDRNGHYVRYEILINREAFDYIVGNQLYHVDGQNDFIKNHQRFVFPIGTFELADKKDPFSRPAMDPAVDNKRPKTERVGAIILKAAWKHLSAEELKSGRFHTRKTLVYTPHDEKNNAKRQTLTWAHLGLVGLHIVHKSADVAQWNWSTFEHVDNCPDYADRAKDEKAYSFFDPKAYSRRPAAARDRSLNQPPPRPWNPNGIELDEERLTQLVRIIPITEDVRKLNDEFHERLRKANEKSVWQYYDLVFTQWPTRPAALTKSHHDRDGNVLKHSPADILGGPAPVFLANTVLESYIQGTTPNASSSCMECHANALSRNGHFADFTYILERAKSKPKK